MIQLDIGCGRLVTHDHIGIDKVQIVGSNGKKSVDVVMDVEKEKLPYDDATVDHIQMNNALEHFDDMRFVLNECWRVLKPGCSLNGNVPVAGSKEHWKDPTHKRGFIKETFDYFTGKSTFMEGRPSHPRYADYGYLAWDIKELKQEGDLIFFELTPQKV